MVDSGSAQIVMGNHEFNAIAYATERPDGSGEFLRRHIEKNTKQHRAFLDQITGPAHDDCLQWFKTIPLWLDLGGLRIIHACWHEPSMRVVERELGSNRFNSMDQFVRAATKDEPLYDAVEVLLKGPELSLTDHGQLPYCDKDGHARDRCTCRLVEGERDDASRACGDGRQLHDGTTGDPIPSFPTSRSILPSSLSPTGAPSRSSTGTTGERALHSKDRTGPPTRLASISAPSKAESSSPTDGMASVRSRLIITSASPAKPLRSDAEEFSDARGFVAALLAPGQRCRNPARRVQ